MARVNAQFSEHEVSTRLLEAAVPELDSEPGLQCQALLTLVEPVMIVLMGGIVLLIVLAILLPIIEINQLVR